MPKQTDGPHFDVVLYPDVARAGDFSLALQAEFDAKGQPWRARPFGGGRVGRHLAGRCAGA
jgi:hypothetical protein